MNNKELGNWSFILGLCSLPFWYTLGFFITSFIWAFSVHSNPPILYYAIFSSSFPAITCFISIIFGIKCLIKKDQSRGAKSLAIAGIILSTLDLVLLYFISVFQVNWGYAHY